MPATVIAYVLQNDILDRTAQDAVNANPPGTFVGGASSVPPHLYLSLKTLWLGPSASTSDFQNQIVPDLGTGQSNPKGSIVIVADTLSESVIKRRSIRSDQPGAEVSNVKILLYKPRALSLSVATLQNVSFRIRYLIDNNLRGVRGLSGCLPNTAVYQDITLDPRAPFFCFYLDVGEPVLASEATLLYSTDYVRLFTR